MDSPILALMIKVSRIIQPLLLMVGLLAFCRSASAQLADVIRPDPRGDFRSLLIRGPRGEYVQRFWLVVDRDPRGLWCRDSLWRPLAALRPGAVLETDLQDRALTPLLNRQGAPYLRVWVKPMDVLEEARSGDRGKQFSCAVRANINYLAPIHPDSLESVRLRP